MAKQKLSEQFLTRALQHHQLTTRDAQAVLELEQTIDGLCAANEQVNTLLGAEIERRELAEADVATAKRDLAAANAEVNPLRQKASRVDLMELELKQTHATAEATASEVVKWRGRAELAEARLAALAGMVSDAVEQMAPDDVNFCTHCKAKRGRCDIDCDSTLEEWAKREADALRKDGEQG